MLLWIRPGNFPGDSIHRAPNFTVSLNVRALAYTSFGGDHLLGHKTPNGTYPIAQGNRLSRQDDGLHGRRAHFVYSRANHALREACRKAR